jgi:hypothetical protein
MGHQHRLDRQRAKQRQHFVQGQSLRLDLGQGILDPAGLRTAAVGKEVLPAPADAMHFFREVYRLEPGRECTDEITRHRRWTTGHALRQAFGNSLDIAPQDGFAPIAFDQRVQLVAPLLPQHLAHQHAQLVYVFTQGQVLGRELDLVSVHGHGFYRVGRAGWPLAGRRVT